MRIAVTGARGLLGSAIVQAFQPGHEVVPLLRADLDICDGPAVRATMERVRPDAIVNCAAYNDVDGAEDHHATALTVNAFGVRALAAAALAVDAVLVQYSSDFVFDGTGSTPYIEDDRPNPESVYASSKLLGECFAAVAPRHYVLRVESLFGHLPGQASAKGTVAALTRKIMAGEETVIFADRTASATYSTDAARATRHLLEMRAPAGLYHCVNSGACTWLELASELARQLDVIPRLVPVRMADVPLRAARPKYCALSNGKLTSTGFAMPTWQDALTRFLPRVRESLTTFQPAASVDS